MLTFAPNISWLFPELAFRERPAEVARLGFTAIEFGFPSHADLPLYRQPATTWGCRSSCSTRMYRYGTERTGVIWSTRSAETNSSASWKNLWKSPERLKVLKIMLPSGVEVPGLARQAQRAVHARKPELGCPAGCSSRRVIHDRSLNPVDNPGYFLTSSTEALEIVKELNHPNVRFQFDTYHIQMMESNLVTEPD